MLSAVTAKVLGALFKIPLTNILGGVGMSYFSCAYSLFMPVYALTVTGLSSAVARMTAKSAALGMYSNIRRVRRTALLIFSAVGLSGSILVLLLAKPFSLLSTGSTEPSLAVAMIAPSVFFGCITSVERGYYEGLSNMYPTAISQAVEGIVKVVSGLLLCQFVSVNGSLIMARFPEITDIRAVSAAAGILGVTLSSVGAMIFFMFLSFFRKHSAGGESHLMTYGEISRELVRTAFPIGVSAVVTNLTAVIDMATIIGCITKFGCADKIPVGIAENDIPKFIYGSFSGIALTVFNLVPSVTNMLGKGVLPCITSAWEAGDKNELQRGTVQALMSASLISVPSAVGIGILSPEILNFLFAKQSEEAQLCITPLRMLMPGMICLCISFPLFGMLQGIGKASVPLKIMLAGTAVKLIGNIVMIPLMGVSGASLATSLCYAMILIVSLAVYIKSADIKISMSSFLAVVYAGILCGVSAYLASDISKRYGMGNVSVIFLSAVSGGAVYLLSLYLLSVKIKKFPRSGIRGNCI
ncbi:MAG: polysaccharide biosynthesis C-terminal domain-containing protein [Ruminococcus sp.]|nr:polysaccharide biosynthesis C-terminal domain-containing protein [Ruminococcus sp.]